MSNEKEAADMRSDMKDVCANAVLLQDASNLSGVVKAWGRDLSTVWAIANKLGKDTGWVNKHPINTLYVSKLGSLSQSGDTETGAFHKAYEYCKRMQAGRGELDYTKEHAYATLFCALCEQQVRRGGHMCVTDTDNVSARRPEEHLAMCGTCRAFHEPHCGR